MIVQVRHQLQTLFPLHLTTVDSGTAQTTFDRIAEAIAAFEGSPEVSPFTAKYDT